MKRKSMKRKSMKRKSMKRKSMKRKSMKRKSMNRRKNNKSHRKYMAGGGGDAGESIWADLTKLVTGQSDWNEENVAERLKDIKSVADEKTPEVRQDMINNTLGRYEALAEAARAAPVQNRRSVIKRRGRATRGERGEPPPGEGERVAPPAREARAALEEGKAEEARAVLAADEAARAEAERDEARAALEEGKAEEARAVLAADEARAVAAARAAERVERERVERERVEAEARAVEQGGAVRAAVVVDFVKPGSLGMRLTPNEASQVEVVQINKGTQAEEHRQLKVGQFIKAVGDKGVGSFSDYPAFLAYLREQDRPLQITLDADGSVATSIGAEAAARAVGPETLERAAEQAARVAAAAAGSAPKIGGIWQVDKKALIRKEADFNSDKQGELNKGDLIKVIDTLTLDGRVRVNFKKLFEPQVVGWVSRSSKDGGDIMHSADDEDVARAAAAADEAERAERTETLERMDSNGQPMTPTSRKLADKLQRFQMYRTHPELSTDTESDMRT